MVEKKKEKKVKAETKQKKVETEKTVKEGKTGKPEKKISEEKKEILIKGKSPGKKTEVEKTKISALRKEEKKVYRVTGSFLMGSRYQTFTKEVMASDPREKIYSDFGSRHKIKRRNIKMEDVKELKNDEITDPLLKQLAKGE